MFVFKFYHSLGLKVGTGQGPETDKKVQNFYFMRVSLCSYFEPIEMTTDKGVGAVQRIYKAIL